MRQEDESVAKPEVQATPGQENLELPNELHIPDYVMLDFGSLEGRGTSGEPPAS